METIRTIAWMKEYSRQARAEGQIIGLVPTMGALHAGHLALIQRAKQECSNIVASIFLNPKQFGPQEDLSRYPRPIESDIEKLISAQTDALFLPNASEIYPPEFTTTVNVDKLCDLFEGRSRPGHFRGVTTIVLKLLQIVQPNYAYFGRKDAQQARLITQMARDLNLDSEIVTCPIVRDHDGLALSSRNVYLDARQRAAATVLFRSLTAAKNAIMRGVTDSLQLQSVIQEVLRAEPLARLDYAAIVDAQSFEPILRIARPSYALLAVRIGNTRLLDNMLIEPSASSSADFVVHL